MKKTHLIKALFLFAIMTLFFTPTVTHAQTGFDDDVDDQTPVAPIDDMVYVVLISGLAIGLMRIRKKAIER